jgi:hypothetical protein
MRRCTTVMTVGLIVLTPVLAADAARTYRFAGAEAGKLPAGWATAKTGPGEGSVWTVVADDTAPSKSGFVLAQTAAGPTRLFNLCVVDGSSFKDGEVSVTFKSIKGDIDQGGGVVWRYRDANNYYICRYNPLEENFRVYKVVEGKRVQLATHEGLDVPDGKWATLSIKQAGNRIECSVNGTKYLEVTDDTFKDAGKVGLWTKADAHTHFDQFRVTPAGQ